MSVQQPTVQGPGIPGRGWYVVALLIFLAGMAAFAAFLVWQLNKIGDDLVRVNVPGRAELTLAAGDYTIFNEQRAAAEGRIAAAGDLSGMSVRVEPPGGGVIVPLTPDGSSRYTLGGVSGRSLFTFKIVEPGLYRLIAAYDDGRGGPQGVLAIGRGFVGGLLATIFGSLAITFGGAAIAGAIAFGVYRRRRKLLPPGAW